jgi:4-azaleucine resistance transporter AzlC
MAEASKAPASTQRQGTGRTSTSRGGVHRCSQAPSVSNGPARCFGLGSGGMLARYREGIRISLPFALAVLAFGISFGVLARSAGMGTVAPIVFSATTWAGSAQFAVAAIFNSDGAVLSAITAAILLNSRYLAMSAALAPSLSGGPVRRALHGLAVVDESWALSARGDGSFDPDKLVGVALMLYPSWLLGTAIGAIGGDAIGDPETLGLDAAFPALFLALMITQMRKREHVIAGVLGGLIALALVPLTPAGVPIIAASAAALVGVRGR